MLSGEYILINILKNMLNKGLITKDQLKIINRHNLNYPLGFAEKDYFLALVSKIIHESDLKDSLIFKGGTAIHHVYLPQLRFSEDLDFSTNGINVSLEQVVNMFKGLDYLEVKKHFTSNATIKIERLMYSGVLEQPNSLKIEIDFLQNVVLPPLELNYNNFYGINTKVRVMDIREIIAEKIRAMNERARYRDFYDFSMIIKKIGVDINEAVKILKQKEMRTLITKDNILNNWELSKKEKEDIFYTEKIQDEEVKKILEIINF